MEKIISDPAEIDSMSHLSPCGKYERRDLTSENLIGIGKSYMAHNLDNAREVLWVEVTLVDADIILVRHHFDTIIRFNHPNLLNCHTYWLKETSENCLLFFICELVSNTLPNNIKRSRAHKKSIPLKTQIRICRQILLGLSYVKSQNPPFFIPNLCCRSIFMGHDGTTKISCIFANCRIKAVLLGRTIPTTSNSSPFYTSLLMLSRVVYAMATLDLESESLPLEEFCALIKGSSQLDQSQIDFINLIMKNHNVKISDLLLSQFLFIFPSLKLMAGTAILKSRRDLNIQDFDKPSSDVFAIMVESGKKYIYSDIHPSDLHKYLTEIKQGLHPLMNVASTEGVIYSTDPSQTTSPPNHTIKTHVISSILSADENQTNLDSASVLAIQCRVDGSVSSPCLGKSFRRLKLWILFRNMYCRQIECDVNPDEISAESLATDFIYYKLVSPEYLSHVISVISQCIQGEEFSIIVPAK